MKSTRKYGRLLMICRKGVDNLTKQYEDLSAQIEDDFIALLDDWFSLPETWDNELDAQIAKWYSNPPNVFPKRPYFSPSSLGDCPRELYIKAKHGNKVKDTFRQPPWQGRWKKLGTLGGDLIQRELLAIERNYEKQTGNAPRFRFLRNEDSDGNPTTPMFEDFAKTNKLVEHNGEKFYLYGAPDGIMQYVTDNGEPIRVGIEIKSKQGTPARTSLYSMKGPDEAHARQVVAYSEMYDCDYYVILYVNYAKQGWNMTDEQYAKTPDIRAFCQRVTAEDKARVFDKEAMVTKAVRENKPPKKDIDGWTFNNFKEATAKSLTAEEFDELVTINERYQHSSLPAWRKRQYAETIEMIERLREGSD